MSWNRIERMNLSEHMNRKTAYTAQELADVIGEPLKAVEHELNNEVQRGKIAFESARGYKFYYIKE